METRDGQTARALDDFSGDKVVSLVNSRGFERDAKMKGLILTLEAEIEQTKNISMADWKKKILTAFETGQSDVELSEKLRK